jgi:hypothetical protein
LATFVRVRTPPDAPCNVVAHVERAVAGWRDEDRSLGMSDTELESFERDATRRA